jgi:arsenical pump membrane protein
MWISVSICVITLVLVMLRPKPLNEGTAAAIGAFLMLAGPNLTIVGSLASLLWLAILRQRGLEVSPFRYFKVGLALTPPMLLASIGSLYAMSQFHSG